MLKLKTKELRELINIELTNLNGFETSMPTDLEFHYYVTGVKLGHMTPREAAEKIMKACTSTEV